MQAYTKTVGVRLLDVPQHLDREYTYYVPQTLWLSLAVGDFVLVPFGAANKKHSALVTSISETEDYSKLKPILAQINASLSLDDEMMSLVRFLCDRTLCTMGDAVHAMIPAGAEGLLLHKVAEFKLCISEKNFAVCDCLYGFGFYFGFFTVRFCNKSYLCSVGISEGNSHKRALFDN